MELDLGFASRPGTAVSSRPTSLEGVSAEAAFWKYGKHGKQRKIVRRDLPALANGSLDEGPSPLPHVGTGASLVEARPLIVPTGTQSVLAQSTVTHFFRQRRGTDTSSSSRAFGKLRPSGEGAGPISHAAVAQFFGSGLRSVVESDSNLGDQVLASSSSEEQLGLEAATARPPGTLLLRPVALVTGETGGPPRPLDIPEEDETLGLAAHTARPPGSPT